MDFDDNSTVFFFKYFFKTKDEASYEPNTNNTVFLRLLDRVFFLPF